jgi:alcohol dehydrogenase class IV
MNDEMPEGLSGEWLDEFMRRALPHVLSKCAEAEPAVVADLARLVRLEREMFPPKEVPRQIVWVDNLDEEIEEEERLAELARLNEESRLDDAA